LNLLDSYYLCIIPEPYSPEDYQELEDEIVHDEECSWTTTSTDGEIEYIDLTYFPITNDKITIKDTGDSWWQDYDRIPEEYLDPCQSCPNKGRDFCHCTMPSRYSITWSSTGYPPSKTRYK
jgi:hypothetical protein